MEGGLLMAVALFIPPALIGLAGLYGVYFFFRKMIRPNIDIISRIGNGIFLLLCLTLLGFGVYAFSS